MTFRLRCKGTFAIKSDRQGAQHEGKHYAYHGDVAECGARLISSLSPATDAGMAQASSSMPTSVPSMANAADQASQYIDRFLLIDREARESLGRWSYEVKHKFDLAARENRS